jgi:putative transposase
MLRAYKYELNPTEEQKLSLSKLMGCVRFVYNLALETKITAYSMGKSLSCFDLIKQLPDLKKDLEWLRECPSQPLQQTISNLDTAYTNFFKKRAAFPKFKSKKNKQSVRFPSNVIVDFENYIVDVPKLRKIRFFKDRLFKGEIKQATISKTPTFRYFISILVETGKQVEAKKPIKEATTVGIDFGVKTFATLSDGTSFANNHFFKNVQRTLRIEQRKLSRRLKKGSKEQSKSYQRQRLLVAKLHEKITNKRHDYLHKISTSIIKKYDTVCLEDLNISGMLKNKNLSLAIAETSWNEFEIMLKYKAEWYGKNILYIGRFDPSSKLCSKCGAINKELQLKDREWTCSECGTKHDRDENAATNIKTMGLRTKPLSVNVKHLACA